VADASLNYDRAVKRALYTRHAIQELWIVDLTAGEVEVCRQPEADGYATTVRVRPDDELQPQLLPGVHIQAAALFR
jgi:Uma2 family endonuclease